MERGVTTEETADDLEQEETKAGHTEDSRRQAGRVHEAQLARLARAQDALREGYVARLPTETVGSPYQVVTDAMNELTLAAENGYQLAVGPLEGLSPTQIKAAQGSRDARAWQQRVVASHTARQSHLLDANAATTVRQPTVVPIDGSVELGPFWPQVDYLDISQQPKTYPGPPPLGHDPDGHGTAPGH